MKTPFQSPKFKKTQSEWYKKLKLNGFEDAEIDEARLKKWDSHYYHARYDVDSFEAKQEYFSQATHFLNAFGLLKLIWTLHSDGLSYREISASMDSKGISCNKDKVNLIINNLKGIMKVQLNGEEFESRRSEIRRHHNDTSISEDGFQLSLFDVA